MSRKKKSHDGTIDLSHLTKAGYQRKIRELQKITTSPCGNCRGRDRCETSSTCDLYQKWRREYLANVR